MSEYGHQPSVLEAINELHLALERNYMRSGLSINLEPDAFYRLSNELLGEQLMTDIAEEIYLSGTLRIIASCGDIIVKKDDCLGINGYTKTYRGK